MNQSADRGFLYFRGIVGVEECSLEGKNIGEFRGRVSVVSVPAGAIVYLDTALFFRISDAPIEAGGSRSISWKMQLFFSVEVL